MAMGLWVIGWGWIVPGFVEGLLSCGGWLVGAVVVIVVDCWVFFGQCLFVLQAAFVKSRKSLSTSSGVRYPRAE